MTDTDSTRERYPSIPLTRPIRRCLLRNGFIDENGHILERKARRSPPRRTVHPNLYTRSLDFERKHRPRTATSPKRRRITADDSRLPARPTSPTPPLHMRRPLSASLGRTRPTRTNASLQRLPPKKTILLRLATSPQIYSSDQRCLITIQYLGPQSKVEYDQEWIEPDGDEIMVMQQHCGGENLIVFRGCVRKQGLFQFESRRHADFPLGLAFYINNIIINRLSLCCEARCGTNKRIGGPSGAFMVIKMDKAKPCRQCRFKERMRLLDEREEKRQGNKPGPTGGRSPPRDSPPPTPPPRSGPSHTSPPSSSPRSKSKDSPSPQPVHKQAETTRSPERNATSPYSSDFNSSVDNLPPPPKPKPKSVKTTPPATGDSGKLGRPGSASEDPRGSPKTKPISPTYDDDGQDSGSKPSGGQHKPASPVEIVRAGSPPKNDDDRTTGKKARSPATTPTVQPLNDVPSDDEILPPKPKHPAILNQTSSSDSTGAQVQQPQWNTTMPQPQRSTPSPDMRNLGRRTSLDRRVASPPIRSPSPLANRNSTDSMPSPIPRARETPTNEIESPKPPVRSIASDVETDDETIEEELQNIRTTTDDDQDNAASDTADWKH